MIYSKVFGSRNAEVIPPVRASLLLVRLQTPIHLRGVTLHTQVSYNVDDTVVKPCTMNSHHLASAALKTALGICVRGAWSRPISLRADVKLAPSKVRPNLFSGD